MSPNAKATDQASQQPLAGTESRCDDRLAIAFCLCGARSAQADESSLAEFTMVSNFTRLHVSSGAVPDVQNPNRWLRLIDFEEDSVDISSVAEEEASNLSLCSISSSNHWGPRSGDSATIRL